MRRRVVGAGVVVVLLAAGAAAAVARAAGDDDGAGAADGPTATEPVERRTLARTEDVDGTLDFGDPRGVVAGRAGTVTSVVAPGATVGRGEELFAVDRQPTVLLVGGVPLYRPLTVGVDDGPDVTQLEENLMALGFIDGGGLTVDGVFDRSTRDAVAAWQQSLGVEATGTVAPGDAVFGPEAARIADARVDVGAQVPAGTRVVDLTPSTHVARAQLDLTEADLAGVGDAVGLTLPDGREAAGTVVAVTDAAASPAEQEGEAVGGAGAMSGSSAGAAPTVEVTIALDDPAAAEAFATVAVEVHFTGSRREDVLTVPVVALVALLEGGYAVEVPAQGDAGPQLVAVAVGMFADGYVEVSGEGLDEGTEVVVPR